METESLINGRIIILKKESDIHIYIPIYTVWCSVTVRLTKRIAVIACQPGDNMSKFVFNTCCVLSQSVNFTQDAKCVKTLSGIFLVPETKNILQKLIFPALNTCTSLSQSIYLLQFAWPHFFISCFRSYFVKLHIG